jgi:hypothetical protein
VRRELAFAEITNVAGATNSASVALAVSPPPSLVLSANRSGSVQLTASTLAGINYVLQAATNLNPPVSWLSVSTNAAPADGLIVITNTMANPEQFFRLLFP